MTPAQQLCHDAFQIIQKQKLSHVWQYYVDKCTSTALPYHNRYHTMTMVKNVAEAADYYYLLRTWKDSLIVAAIFHDFNHSGGVQNDRVNITNARREFNYFYTNYHQGPAENSINPVFVDQMIETTMFVGGEFPNEPTDLIQQIIRDADLLQISEPNWYDMVIEGIRAELVNGGLTLSEDQMVRGQIDFMKKHFKFYTEWGKARWNSPVVQTRVAQLIGNK